MFVPVFVRLLVEQHSLIVHVSGCKFGLRGRRRGSDRHREGRHPPRSSGNDAWGGGTAFLGRRLGWRGVGGANLDHVEGVIVVVVHVGWGEWRLSGKESSLQPPCRLQTHPKKSGKACCWRKRYPKDRSVHPHALSFSLGLTLGVAGGRGEGGSLP